MDDNANVANSNVAWLMQGVQSGETSSPELPQGALSLDALEVVALTAEYRRLATGSHNWRVAQLSALLGKKLGLGEVELELIKQAAPLHDIGTIFIPESILLKPTKLSEIEFETVKRHVDLGAKLLQDANTALLKTAQLIIEGHHERYDGSGYPAHKRGSDISPIAQIVALADVFDTATHPQPYRDALPVSKAMQQVREQRGQGFDPKLVDAFTEVLGEQTWLVRSTEGKLDPHQKLYIPGSAQFSPSATTLKGTEQNILISGQLGTLNLFDLIGSLTQNRQSGKLHVHLGALRGLILVYEGRILHASFQGLIGQEALFKLFSHVEQSHDAFFTFEAWPEPGEQEDLPELELLTVQTPTNKLLFDIAVQLDHEMSERNQ
ncbi:MAG: HD domain-containing phosphohydrolase [Trueperaceae bacterium]